MATWKYSEDKTHVLLNEPSTKRLKITGTRFGAVLGLNKWSTPFQMWCEVTKVAKKPFVGNDATHAGNIIEVKQQRWARQNLSLTIQSPETYYNSENVKSDQAFDFFKSDPIFGGMWDAVDVDHGKITNVIEFKTTKRADDWIDEPPIYYQVQVLLYAHLLGVKDCTLVCSFVDESDYIDPYAYIVDDTNTRIWKLNTETTLIEHNGFKRTIAELVDDVLLWYEKYIEGGISPEFDPKKDKDYLDLMQTTYLSMATEIDALIEQRMALESEVERLMEELGINKLQEDVAAIDSEIKRQLSESLTDEHRKVVYKNVSVIRTDKRVVDTKLLKEAGLYEDFTKISSSVSLKVKKEKED